MSGAAKGDEELCRSLLDHGAPVTSPLLMTRALKSGIFKCCELLACRGAPISDAAFISTVEARAGRSLLGLAKDKATFDFLLEKGATESAHS